MQRRMRLAVLLTITLGMAATASAQQVVQMTEFNRTGTVVNGNANAITMTVLGAQTVVHIDSQDFLDMRTAMELKAPAKNSLLAPGVFVRFNAKIDAKGKKLLEPISKVTIFSPTPETRFGIFAEEMQVPALDGAGPPPDGGLGGQPIGPRPGPGPLPPREPPPAPVAGGEVFIVGKITRARKGEIAVQLPDRQIEARLADDVAIDVHLTDKAAMLAVLRPGDPIQVDGMMSEAGKVYATRITANLQRELGQDVPAMRSTPPVARAGGEGEGEKAPNPQPKPEADAIAPGEDFGIAAAEAEKAAAEKEERAALPQRARILRVN